LVIVMRIILFLLTLWCLPVLAQQIAVPELRQQVTDITGTLSTSEQQSLTQQLQDITQKTRAQDRSEERRLGEGCQTCIGSRHRHTKSNRYWSSDVCSSDLVGDRYAYNPFSAHFMVPSCACPANCCAGAAPTGDRYSWYLKLV